jgi:hypothetical protein
MARYILVATSSAKDGRDDEYNAWYDSTHLADICALPGVISGRRFNALPFSPNPLPGDYLAIFEIETDDPAGVLAEMRRRAQSGEMHITDSIDMAATQLWLCEAR